MSDTRYYILIGRTDRDTPYEMIFGDYSRPVVAQEQLDTTDYSKMRIRTCFSSTLQRDIDNWLAVANGTSFTWESA